MTEHPLILSRDRIGHQGLTEEEHDIYDEMIRETHALIVQYGSYMNIPADIERELCRRNRETWTRYSERRGRNPANLEEGPYGARDKTKRLLAWCAEHKGEVVKTHVLSDAVECAPGTVYAFIRDHPTVIRRVWQGSVYIVDPDAERARDAAVAAAGPLANADGANGAAAALAAFTGHAPAPVAAVFKKPVPIPGKA